ncbi:hypothetical protein, partial [Vibrio vulnificus]|uniref:hypothetical protein n=1 Tax=Vibrio vulnificus TaxID=672 RepID=UPI00193DF8D5
MSSSLIPSQYWKGPGEAGIFRAFSRAGRKPSAIEAQGFRRVASTPSLFPDGRQRRGRSISTTETATS